MRDDDIRRRLADANPWWKSVATGADPTAWASSHRLLLDRATYDLGYRSTILDDVAANSPNGSLTVLTGPRRAGKSVVLLDTVKKLCRRNDIDPRQIIHLPCDGMVRRDITRSLTLARDLTKSVDGDGKKQRIWMIDEISAIDGWSAELKMARDGSDFGDDTVVATGSRWRSDEDIQGNLIAGRAGSAPGHRIRQLLPMTFRAYMIATQVEFGDIPVAHPADLQGESVRGALGSISYIIDDLDLAWQAFLTSGGFPRAVFEYFKSGAVSEAYARDLAAWLRADVDRDADTESVPVLLEELSSRMTSPLNATAAARDMDYNRNVFDLRIRRLINAHAAIECRQVNDKGRARAGTQSKLYLTDPILSWIPSIVSPGLKAPDMTQLNEAAIAIALARAIDAHDESRWVSGDTIGYARTKSGNEVDLAPVRVPTAAGHSMTTPIEGKWVDNRWKGETHTIRNKFGRGIVATKSILDLDGDIWAVPAPVVALLLA